MPRIKTVADPFGFSENVRRLASLPLLHQPGSAYQYSLSTDVLGRLVELISGVALESFMRNVAGVEKDQVASPGSYYWGGFYGTSFWVDPQKKLVGVFMTQLSPSDQTLHEDFRKLAYDAIQSTEQVPINRQPVPQTLLTIPSIEDQLPEYRGWTHVKSALIGPKSKAFATEGGIHHIYANEKAMAGIKTGQFQNGSILIYDLLEVTKADGITFEEQRRRTDMMVKDDIKSRDTGGWEFRQFIGTDRRSAKLTASQRANCFECPNRQKEGL